MTRMSPLFAMLHIWAATPFLWGENDCILSICDWVAGVTGRDPGASVRGTYFDAASCARETGYFRDPVGVVDGLMASAGLSMVDRPQVGDVAVLRLRDMGARPIGGLWTGSAWAMKSEGGVATRPAAGVEVLAAWGVGYEA